MDGGLESRCVGRVCGAVRCGADVAVGPGARLMKEEFT